MIGGAGIVVVGGFFFCGVMLKGACDVFFVRVRVAALYKCVFVK